MKKLFAQFLAALLIATTAQAECQIVEHSSTSVIVRLKITDSTTGNGKTGLTSATSNLAIYTIADNEDPASAGTSYTSAGSTIETITTLGTYAAPSTNKARFKLLSDTKHPGVYEVQLANARYAVSGAKNLLISIPSISGSGTLDADCNVPLVHPLSDIFLVTLAELSSLPSKTAPTIAQALMFIYQWGTGRYKTTTTATTKTLLAEDESTSRGTCSVADDGTTYTRGECN